MRWWIPFVLVPALAVPCRAEDEPAARDQALDAALTAFFAEPDPQARALAGVTLAARHPDPAVVARALPGVRRWEAERPEDEYLGWKRATADGVVHTVYAYVPPAYDPSRPWPVLVWLHGAVSRDEDQGGLSAVRSFAAIAEQEGFLVLSPSSQRGAEWWTPNGVDLVRGALGDLARRCRVDPDRVAVGGFSDGASGCFHLLAHDPEPYCCFLAMMAHPGVTRLAGGPTYAANARSRPVLAMSGGIDPLYPSARIKPLMDELKAAGCALTWVDLPAAGHQLGDVLPARWPELRAFWQAHPRKPLAREVAWETAVPAREGRFGWVEILTVDAGARSTEGADEILQDPTGRPRLGVSLDTTYAGPGLRIEHVEPDSAAADAGFEVGDVLLALGSTSLTGSDATVALMRALAALDTAEGLFKVKRGDAEVEVRCAPRVVGNDVSDRPKELGYGLPSARVVARAHEDGRIELTTRHVGRLALHLADGLVDLAKPVRVFVNGKLRFEGLVAGDTGYVLQQAAARLPGGPVYRAKLIVTP